MKEIVEYTQDFFGKWMKYWGYETKEALPVKKNKDGYPEILYVKGKYTEASGRYKKLGFQAEVMQQAAKKYGIEPTGEVWALSHALAQPSQFARLWPTSSPHQ